MHPAAEKACVGPASPASEPGSPKDNPYDTGKFNAYYEWVKTNIFTGREFGPAPGTKASCNVTQDQIPTPTPDWVKALSGD